MAFTTLESRGVRRVWRAASVQAAEAFLAVPGQVMFRQDECPVIACGEGALILRQITVDGTDDAHAALALAGKSLRNRLI